MTRRADVLRPAGGPAPRRHRGLGRAALALVLALVLTQPVAAQAAGDPLEDWNRRVHAANARLQAQILAPLARAYVAATPAWVRQGAGNILANLGEPLTALSSLAGGEPGQAAHAAARFGINSTLGLGGLRDRASAMGYPRQSFTLADAACGWGVPAGPYLVLPLLGPSTLRDAAALLATSTALSQALGTEPVLAWSGGDLFLGFAAAHEDLARIEAEALDAYAVLRSAYLQRRASRCPADRLPPAAEAD